MSRGFCLLHRRSDVLRPVLHVDCGRDGGPAVVRLVVEGIRLVVLRPVVLALIESLIVLDGRLYVVVFVGVPLETDIVLPALVRVIDAILILIVVRVISIVYGRKLDVLSQLHEHSIRAVVKEGGDLQHEVRPGT